MSDKTDMGGPAFPVAEDHKIADEYEWTAGAQLWDYYAAHAPVIPVGTFDEQTGTQTYATAAREAAEYADAMLRERTKRTEGQS